MAGLASLLLGFAAAVALLGGSEEHVNRSAYKSFELTQIILARARKSSSDRFKGGSKSSLTLEVQNFKPVTHRCTGRRLAETILEPARCLEVS